MQGADFLSPHDVCRRYGGRISPSTLGKWRTNGQKTGPAFMRLGGRIFYPLEKLIEWEKQNQYMATQDYAAPKLTAA